MNNDKRKSQGLWSLKSRLETPLTHVLNAEADLEVAWGGGLRRGGTHVADRLFNPAKHGCRGLDWLGGFWAVSSGPYLRGSRLRGGPPRSRVFLPA